MSSSLCMSCCSGGVFRSCAVRMKTRQQQQQKATYVPALPGCCACLVTMPASACSSSLSMCSVCGSVWGRCLVSFAGRRPSTVIVSVAEPLCENCVGKCVAGVVAVVHHSCSSAQECPAPLRGAPCMRATSYTCATLSACVRVWRGDGDDVWQRWRCTGFVA